MPTQQTARANALREDVARTAAILQHRRLADSLIPLALAGGASAAFGAPPGLDETVVVSQRERMEREVRDEGLEGTPVALGLFLVPAKAGAYRGQGGMVAGTEYYWGTREGRAYCVAARAVMTQMDDRLALTVAFPDQDVLGVCGLVARYGLPGPAVADWLGRAGTAFASSLKPSRGLPDYWGAYARMGLDPATPGRSATFRGPGNLTVSQCLAGVTEGCARLLTHPADVIWWYGSGSRTRQATVMHSPLSAVQGETFLAPVDAHAVADMARDFGEARVQAFWHANGDVAQAFRAAFGEDVGAWNLERLRPMMGVRTAGPMPTLAGLLGGMLVVSLCAAVAGWWASRRRVA